MKSNINNFFTTESLKETRKIFALIDVLTNFRRQRSMNLMSSLIVFINKTICWFFQTNKIILSSMIMISYNLFHFNWISCFNLRSLRFEFNSRFFFCFFWVDSSFFFFCFFRLILMMRTMSIILNFNFLNTINKRIDVKNLFNHIMCRWSFNMLYCFNRFNIIVWIFEKFIFLI
jgi:hypothetical protein